MFVQLEPDNRHAYKAQQRVLYNKPLARVSPEEVASSFGKNSDDRHHACLHYQTYLEKIVWDQIRD